MKLLLTSIRRGSKSLEIVDLSFTQLNAKGTKELLMWLGQNIQVKDFSVSNNAMAEKGAAELAKVVADSLHKIAKLDIKFCQIPSKSLRDICEKLSNNKRIEVLSLSGNPIKKKTGLALCDSLNTMKALSTLNLRSCSLVKPTLIELFKTLRKHQHLTNLDIAVNTEISSNDVGKELEDFLGFCHKLEVVNLSACDMSSQVLQNVFSGMGRSRTLRVAHLDANKIGKHLSKLMEAINKNPLLEEITLRGVDVSKKEVQDFFKSYSNSRDSKLRKIALDRNELSKSDFDMILQQFSHLNVSFEKKVI